MRACPPIAVLLSLASRRAPAHWLGADYRRAERSA